MEAAGGGSGEALSPNKNGMVHGSSFQLFVFIKDKSQSFVSELHTNPTLFA